MHCNAVALGLTRGTLCSVKVFPITWTTCNLAHAWVVYLSELSILGTSCRWNVLDSTNFRSKILKGNSICAQEIALLCSPLCWAMSSLEITWRTLGYMQILKCLKQGAPTPLVLWEALEQTPHEYFGIGFSSFCLVWLWLQDSFIL